jgi:hypothetical protein
MSFVINARRKELEQVQINAYETNQILATNISKLIHLLTGRLGQLWESR